MPTYTLGEIAHHLSCDLNGDSTIEIIGIAPLDKASRGQLSFFTNHHYKPYLSTTQASAVILQAEYEKECCTHTIVMPEPYLGFAKVAKLFECSPKTVKGIHPTAVIGERCEIPESVSIGAHCVIADAVKIGANTIIHPGCVIGEDAIIGEHCLFWSNVTIYHQVKIGNRVILHSGGVIGSDGFGLAKDQDRWEKIPQLGSVVIEDDVEIGASTTVDRGALQDTLIEQGVKIDNQVQIAHNVKIGKNTAIAACTGIAGSTTVGRNCIFGGQVGINGHIEITDHVILTAASGVSNSIKEPGIYSGGMPIQPVRQWNKNAVRFRQLDEITRRLRKIEQQMEKEKI